MNHSDKQLLENVFDSLDRLFDRESRVIDVYQLLFATDKAIKSGDTEISLSSYVVELGKIVRENEPEEIQRDRALMATDKLREILNEFS